MGIKDHFKIPVKIKEGYGLVKDIGINLQNINLNYGNVIDVMYDDDDLFFMNENNLFSDSNDISNAHILIQLLELNQQD